MKYRKLDANGDMVWGQGVQSFYVDDARAVAQAVSTRLLLFTREWFLDLTEGTPWRTRVLGRGTSTTYDPAIKARILGTPGVTGITPKTYSSTIIGRRLTVSCAVDTVYGRAPVTTAAPASAPTPPVGPTLGVLTLSPTVATVGQFYTAAIGGATAGSTIAAISNDGTSLTVSQNMVQGTFTASGSPQVTLTETLAGAVNTPHATVIVISVASSPPGNGVLYQSAPVTYQGAAVTYS